MPILKGILETSLYVDGLARARDFYERLFGLPVLHSDDHMCAYDVGGRSVLLLFSRGESRNVITVPGGTIPPHDGAGPYHIAFSIAADDLPAWEAHLAHFGIEVEGRAKWSRGGVSLYFRDPDGHLLELVTPGLWQGY
jgi:catechol-2,3-dioxygenase